MDAHALAARVSSGGHLHVGTPYTGAAGDEADHLSVGEAFTGRRRDPQAESSVALAVEAGPSRAGDHPEAERHAVPTAAGPGRLTT